MEEATHEQTSATTTIDAPAQAVFDVLADPSAHAAIDGTGWVRQPLDPQPLTGIGQVFRMAMYHDNHPDGDYEMANKIKAFERPRTIAWEPGQVSEQTDELELGGWQWRYDLAPTGESQVAVTLTYDWSAATPEVREEVPFPPFGADHLDNSLRHLAELATSRKDQ